MTDAGAPAVATAAPVVAPSAVGSDQPPWMAVPSATAALLPNMGIGERFQAEANSRPKLKPTVEDAFAALEAAGVKLSEKKQHLGMTFGARYCVGTQAVSGTAPLVQISVCEYISPEIAASSSRYSEDSLKNLMPTRQVIAHKHLALIVRPENASPEATAALDKAKFAFAKL